MTGEEGAGWGEESGKVVEIASRRGEWTEMGPGEMRVVVSVHRMTSPETSPVLVVRDRYDESGLVLTCYLGGRSGGPDRPRITDDPERAELLAKAVAAVQRGECSQREAARRAGAG